MKTRRRTSKKKTKTKTKKIKGGRVIGSGGYGCIFKPALKCKGAKRETGKISKLMTRKYANEEYNDIVKFKPELEEIPNYENYFLIEDVHLCVPDKLKRPDLKHFNEKCKALKKDGYNEENINSRRLKKVLALNMPDGGIDVGDFIEEKQMQHMHVWIQLNNSLVDLLINGILPMNNYSIYHADVKGSNILIDFTINDTINDTIHYNSSNKKLVARLIDWGLSAKYDGGKTIPKVMMGRPFQYNLPFSIVLFNDKFTNMYDSFLEKSPNSNPRYEDIHDFVIDYIFTWNKKRGLGHTKYMRQIMNYLFENTNSNSNSNSNSNRNSDSNSNDNGKNTSHEKDYLKKYIYKYLSDILFAFTKNGKFQRLEYFQNVYLKNIDVWGFVMSYIPMIVFLYKKNKNTQWTHYEKSFLKNMKYIITHYLFESSVKPIEVTSLARDLNNLFIMNEKEDDF
jgi:hypothetical protein